MYLAQRRSFEEILSEIPYMIKYEKEKIVKMNKVLFGIDQFYV